MSGSLAWGKKAAHFGLASHVVLFFYTVVMQQSKIFMELGHTSMKLHVV